MHRVIVWMPTSRKNDSMTKPVRKIRKTVVVVIDSDFADEVPVSSRVLEWEAASTSGGRRAHRVEYAGPSVDDYGSAAYLIDLELECKGANRHDFTKFVRTYLPEASRHFITE